MKTIVIFGATGGIGAYGIEYKSADIADYSTFI